MTRAKMSTQAARQQTWKRFYADGATARCFCGSCFDTHCESHGTPAGVETLRITRGEDVRVTCEACGKTLHAE